MKRNSDPTAAAQPPTLEMLNAWHRDGWPTSEKGDHYQLMDFLGRWLEHARITTFLVARVFASTGQNRDLAIRTMAELNSLQTSAVREYVEALQRTAPPWTAEDQEELDAGDREADDAIAAGEGDEP